MAAERLYLYLQGRHCRAFYVNFMMQEAWLSVSACILKGVTAAHRDVYANFFTPGADDAVQ